jgi:hypothetical protein
MKKSLDANLLLILIHQCCGSGSGIRCLFDPLDPGSGIGFFRIPSGIHTSDTLPFTTTPSSVHNKVHVQIRDPEKPIPDPGSRGVKKAPNPGSGSATLLEILGHPASADQTRSRSPPRLGILQHCSWRLFSHPN